MSKGNMLLGQARGKVGSLVFSRSNGKQITRSRAEVVKNPKTTEQILQRVLLNTVAQSYSLMRPIVDHSFEGVQAGQATMSEYNSRNLKALRQIVADAVKNGDDLNTLYAFTPIGASDFALNAFHISKGSLPKVEPAREMHEGFTRCYIDIVGTTYGDIINALNLQRGDQLTFVQIHQKAGQPVFSFARVILDPMDAGESQPLSTEFLDGGEINCPNPRNSGEFGYIAIDGDKLYYQVGGDSTSALNISAFAVIVSRKNGNDWLRSTSQLILAQAAGYPDYASLGECITMAEQGISSLSDLYLNNAGNGNVTNFSGGSTPRTAKVTGLSVNGESIAAGSTVIVAANAASSLAIVANSIAEGKYAAYRKNGGAWTSPTIITAGAASITGVNIANNDVVEVAVGDYESSTFTPISVFSGKAKGGTTQITGVTVNGTAIGVSGTTNVRENAASTIAIATGLANGKTASYKIGSGSWATPVVVANNAAQFSSVNLADGDVVSFAIGTGATAGEFTAEITYGGTATVQAGAAVTFSNVEAGSESWNGNISIDKLEADGGVTGSVTGQSEGAFAAVVEGNPTIGGTVSLPSGSFGQIVNGSFQCYATRVPVGGPYRLVVGQRESSTLTVEAIYQYTLTVVEE